MTHCDRELEQVWVLVLCDTIGSPMDFVVGTGKELVQIPYKARVGADRDFVGHRAAFLGELIQYNDLKEVTILRQKILDNAFHDAGSTGLVKTNLIPEAQASFTRNWN